MTVRIIKDAGLIRIHLSRPKSGNAVTPDVIAKLDEAVRVAKDPDVRVVLLSGEGTNFCVGADLRHFQADLNRLSVELDAMATGFHSMLTRLAALPVPVVASVQGNVVGGGLGLMLAADVVLAADTLKLATGYTRLGLSADAGVSYFLARQLGPRLARSLLLTARVLDAQDALRLGLVDEVCSASELPARSEEVVARLASGPAAAFAAIKRLVREAETEASLETHLGREQREIVALATSASVADRIADLLGR